MKLLQSFLALIIAATIGTMFLLTHPSITTLPMLARQPHFLWSPNTHRKSLIRENRFDSANQLPMKVFVGRDVYIPRQPQSHDISRPRQPQSHDISRPRQPQSHDVSRPRQPRPHDVSRPRHSSHIGENKTLNTIQVIKELLAKLRTGPRPTQSHPVSPRSHTQQDVPWSFRRLRPIEELSSRPRPLQSSPQKRESVSPPSKQQLHLQRAVPWSLGRLRPVDKLHQNMTRKEVDNSHTMQRRPFEKLQGNTSKAELEKLHNTSRSTQPLPLGRQPQHSRSQRGVPRSIRLRPVENLQRNMTDDELEKRFPFQTKFSFPQPLAVKRREHIAQEQWVQDLRLLLSNVKSRQVALVTSNIQYIDILLNWLISATVRSGMPLGSVIVVSLDRSIHHLLQSKAIPSVYLPPYSLLNPNAYFSVPFERVMMIRLAVMRIINHFGFDVANYDTDAIILRDPRPLYANFSNYDIIGSVGKIPEDLVKEWGITICIGVVVIKASHRTEAYWNSMNSICEESFDDQGKLNCGLKALGIKWFNNDSSYQNTTVTGITKSGLKVSILPYDDICRQLTCLPEMRSRYYIWHKGGHRQRRDKVKYAKEGQTWFLRYHWNSILNNYTGVKWLQSIAYYMATHS